MGIKDWLGGGNRGFDLNELINPLLTWRHVHFVAFPRNEDGYIRHYFQYLDKEGVRNEFVVFHHETAGGLEQQHTAYRKAPEEAYVLLNQRGGPWGPPIHYMTDIGRSPPANTQPIEGHHVLGVSVGSRRRDEAASKAEETKRTKSPFEWEKTPPKPPTPTPGPDLDGFVIGEAIMFGPLNTMARIVDLEQFDGTDGDTHRFVIEFPDEEAELRVPVSKLRDLMSRRRPASTADDVDDESPILESHGFTVDEHVVYPLHGVGRIVAIERQEIAGTSVEMFVVHFKKANMTLQVPTEKHAAIGLRKLSDEI